MIYLTSDTHFAHKNIVGPKISSWSDGYRDFESIDEMNQSIVDSINKVVGEKDTLYHLGDWSFGGKDNIWNFRKQLICKDIRLVLGNHDKHIQNNSLLDNCHYDYESSGRFIEDIVDGKNKYPDPLICPDEDRYVYAHDLFTSVDNYLEFYHEKTLLCLFHYPIAEWNEKNKGSINIHGHCHHQHKPNGKQIDVGWCKWRKPLSIDEILFYTKNCD